MQPLRLGVVGTASVVREIYQYLYTRSRYSPGIQVQAICDTSDRALAELGDQWRIPASRRYRDHREMLSAGGIDAVAVNTPDSMHREPTIDCRKLLGDRIGAEAERYFR